jgi:hypothetical protein
MKLTEYLDLSQPERRCLEKYFQAIRNGQRFGRYLHRVHGKRLRRAKYWHNVRNRWFDKGGHYSDQRQARTS